MLSKLSYATLLQLGLEYFLNGNDICRRVVTVIVGMEKVFLFKGRPVEDSL